MRRGRTCFIALVIMTLALACGSREQAETERGDAPRPSAQPVTVSGFAVRGHEVRSFRPCGTEEPLWAIDRSGTLWEAYEVLAFKNQPYEEIFCIVEGVLGPAPEDGFGADYIGAIEVVKLLYMAKEGFRCNLDLDGFCYRTFGNEPFWSVRVSAEGMTLSMPGYEDRSWTDIREHHVDEGIRYVADGPHGSLDLLITPEPCHDTMSGAYFAYSARMRLGDEGFTGWALKGTGRAGEWR